MRVRVSIENKFFWLTWRVAGLWATCGLLEQGRIASGRDDRDSVRGSLNRQRTTTPRLHDHGKTRGANQSGAVPQLRRLYLRCAMTPLLLLPSAKDDRALRQLLKHGRRELVPGARNTAADHIYRKIEGIDQIGQGDSQGRPGGSKDAAGGRISGLRAGVYGPRSQCLIFFPGCDQARGFA